MKCFKIRPDFYFLFAVGMVLIPFRWLISWMLAAMVHELFHVIALRLLHCKIICIELTSGGAIIETDCTENRKLTISALAGPMGGLLLLSLVSIMPELAVCGFVQSVYNMIPIYPSDGGRAALGALRALTDDNTARKLFKYIECSFIILLCFLSIYGVFRFGVASVLLVIIILLKKKFLANKEFCEYNKPDCRKEVLK